MSRDILPDPSKLKWRRGPKINPEAFLPQNVRVRITTYISEDIYRWLKREGDRTGTPYQILLNQKLREVYEGNANEILLSRIEKLEHQVRELKHSKSQRSRRAA